MPLVHHIPLPTFAYLREQGDEVLHKEEALHQDIRELHIGFLNMMPDAALIVTERQFMHLVGSCNQIAQFYVHPFSIPGLDRDRSTQDYIHTYYETFEQLKTDGLDALIITGANVANPSLEEEAFWEPLQEVISWATKHVPSVLCSCLATHAIVQHLYGIHRTALPHKRWGVYNHRQVSGHPLLRNINTRFDVPHSRHNAISRTQLEEKGLSILVESKEAGVHVAVSPDQFQFVFFQAHPEYDANSLLKEYKREVGRFIADTRPDYPPHPEHYFSDTAAQLAAAHQARVLEAKASGTTPPPFPEAELEPHLDNTWRDTGKAIFNNWLGLVYKVTALDRKQPFVDGVDPNDPLGLKGDLR